MRARRAALATVVLVTVGSATSAASAPDDQPIPVAGTIGWHEGQDDEAVRVSGAVHAVRRIDGGTAVYYSLGVPEGERAPSVYNRALPAKQLGSEYGVFDASAVTVVDAAGLTGYQPMVGEQGCLCAQIDAFDAEAGRLNVAWAVLPPLPPDVDVVDVTVAYGATVSGVPVGDGPLEPTATVDGDALPVLTQGWPELPSVADAGVADPAVYTVDLVRRVSDLDQTVRTSEQADQVEVDIAADVLFAVDSAELSPQASGAIDGVAADIAERGVGKVMVVGHTDDTGEDAYNRRLSEQRAQSVVQALQPTLPAGVTITAEGRGESEPVADNATEEGRRLNRRVTVTFGIEGTP